MILAFKRKIDLPDRTVQDAVYVWLNYFQFTDVILINIKRR